MTQLKIDDVTEKRILKRKNYKREKSFLSEMFDPLRN